MPRLLDQRQKDELASFLDALYELAGYTGQAEWARDADVHETTLSKGRTRTNGRQMDSYNVLRLIRAAAARADTTPEELAVVAARATDSASAIDREILRRLSDISAGVAKALDLLAPDDQASGEAPQSPDNRKSG